MLGLRTTEGVCRSFLRSWLDCCLSSTDRVEWNKVMPPGEMVAMVAVAEAFMQDGEGKRIKEMGDMQEWRTRIVANGFSYSTHDNSMMKSV